MPQSLDPRIPLGVQPAQIQSPFESLKEVVGLKRVMDEERDRAEAQRAQQMISQIMAESGGDWDQALKKLRVVAPPFALKLEGELAEIRKKSFDALKTEVETHKAMTDSALQLFQAVGPNGEGYDLWRAGVTQRTPELAELLPPEWGGEEMRERILNVGMSTKDLVDRRDKSLKALTSGDYQKALFGYLSATASPQEWEDVFDSAHDAFGIPKPVVDQARKLLPEYSDENKTQAALLSMTPEERAKLQGDAETRAISVRGQDVSAATSRRGQDISAATQRRGQDIQLATQPLETVIGPDGKPVLVPRSQARGQQPVTTDTGGGRLSAAAIEKIAGVDQSLGMLGDIETALPTMLGHIGPLQGRVTSARLTTGIGIDQPLAEFAAQVTGLKNSVIKAITGAQMSEPEAKRIMGQVPDLNNPDEVFQARLKTTRRNLETLKKRTIELSGGTVAASSAGSGKVRATGRDGKTYEFPNQAAADAFKKAGG